MNNSDYSIKWIGNIREVPIAQHYKLTSSRKGIEDLIIYAGTKEEAVSEFEQFLLILKN